MEPVAMVANPDKGALPTCVNDTGDNSAISATNEATRDARGNCAAGIPFNSSEMIPLFPSRKTIIS